MSNMGLALEITALGMGLVFAAIILLWGMMNALTSLTADRKPAPGPDPREVVSAEAAPGESDRRARAAAVAVAIALAEQQASGAHPLPAPPAAIVSAWQLGMRTRQMYQKGTPFIRQSPRQDKS